MKNNKDTDTSTVSLTYKDAVFKMRSAGLIIGIVLCVIGIIGIGILSHDKSDTLPVFALACIAMLLSVIFMGCTMSDKIIQLRKDAAASSEKMILAFNPSLKCHDKSPKRCHMRSKNT